MPSLKDRINEIIATQEHHGNEEVTYEQEHEITEFPDAHTLRKNYYGIPFPVKAQNVMSDRGQISGWQLAGPQGEYVIPRRERRAMCSCSYRR